MNREKLEAALANLKMLSSSDERVIVEAARAHLATLPEPPEPPKKVTLGEQIDEVRGIVGVNSTTGHAWNEIHPNLTAAAESLAALEEFHRECGHLTAAHDIGIVQRAALKLLGRLL